MRHQLLSLSFLYTRDNDIVVVVVVVVTYNSPILLKA